MLRQLRHLFYIVTSLINCGRFLSISQASHGHCLIRLLTLCSVGARNRDRWRIIPACIDGLWRERNARYFEDASNNVQKIKHNYILLFYFWCTKVYSNETEILQDVLRVSLGLWPPFRIYFLSSICNYGFSSTK
uniref:Putative ovule protein n=1 Tax=Solanum chacoense TaxID=4108 RepID=A0A0V0HID9_SOLCH